jgi:hypothetical protein
MVACGAGSASQMIDADCKVHLMIDDAIAESNDRGTTVKVTFSVLAGTDHSQVGKRITEFFQCDGKAVDKFYNLAEAAGLITVEQRRAAAEQGVGMDVDETLLKGRQVCAEIKMELQMRTNPATGAREVDPEKPGPYPRIGFRTFALTSPRAKDIPKDARMLAAAGQAPAGRPAAAPATQHAAGQSPEMNW